MKKNEQRCFWAGQDPLMVKYHDEEWGRPVKDDIKHYEFLVLEAAQAGLSWAIVLKKREGYRKAFAGFDPKRVAKFTPAKIEKLVLDASIIRNRLKIEAAVHNAKLFLQVQKEFGSFDKYCWQFVGGKPLDHRLKAGQKIPSTSPESDAFSKDLKKRGFKFVGSTVIYAHMQAVGMINDHLVNCMARKKKLSLANKFRLQID
jgi:DNA-3-methyladenine glycosylase I